MRDIGRWVVAFSLVFPVASHAAFAQISADHRNGAVIVGTSVNTMCNAAMDGAIRYNSAGKFLEYCNGNAWGALGNTLATRPDVLITNVQDGQALAYDSGLTKWVNNACDDIPAALGFTDLTQQVRSSVINSDIVQITGISCSIDVSLTGEGIPEFRICSDSACSSVVTNWTRTKSPVVSGQYVQIRLNSSPLPEITYTATLTAGSASDAWSVTTVPRKKVFVSSATYNGNLGGLSGADAKCQALADAVPLGGTYKAWLSDGTTSAASRITQSSTGYRMVNGTKIADNWADLTDGTINAVLNVTQTGGTAASAEVWTNTSTAGGIYGGGYHCTNWTSSSSGVFGAVGSTNWALSLWTEYTIAACNLARRLYCLEQ